MNHLAVALCCLIHQLLNLNMAKFLEYVKTYPEYLKRCWMLVQMVCPLNSVPWYKLSISICWPQRCETTPHRAPLGPRKPPARQQSGDKKRIYDDYDVCHSHMPKKKYTGGSIPRISVMVGYSTVCVWSTATIDFIRFVSPPWLPVMTARSPSKTCAALTVEPAIPRRPRGSLRRGCQSQTLIRAKRI